MRTYAVIGGGPAGAMAAEALARGGARVEIFEEKLNWEKPCGGGVSARALRRYAFLDPAAAHQRSIDEIEFFASNGARALVLMRQPLAIYSRSMLNDTLLRRAEAAGARIVSDRITRLEKDSSGWSLVSKQAAYHADFAILAAGARTLLRTRLTGALAPHDFMLTFGYYLPGSETRIRVRFFDGIEGYAWVFPRSNHLSVGICGRMTESSMPQLQDRLHEFMKEFGYERGDAPVFAHLLPGLTSRSWSGLRLDGEDWALAGDAAGLVDPITGEGIYYAMRSGEILAECLLENAPAEYSNRIWTEIASDLSEAARLARFLFQSDFSGFSPVRRAVEFCGSSESFRRLTLDLMEGSQPYKTLVPRVMQALGSSLVENTLHRVMKWGPFRKPGVPQRSSSSH